MVVACSGAADSTAVALLAAAHQTGGRLVCILRCPDELPASQATLGSNTGAVEFVVGDARVLLRDRYKKSDFIAVDCNLRNSEEIISAVQEKGSRVHENTIVLGYNAFCTETWKNSPLRTQLLPIGEGLLLTRVAKRPSKSNWIVKVDKCTGEEHVYRVRSSVGRIIRAWIKSLSKNILKLGLDLEEIFLVRIGRCELYIVYQNQQEFWRISFVFLLFVQLKTYSWKNYGFFMFISTWNDWIENKWVHLLFFIKKLFTYLRTNELIIRQKKNRHFLIIRGEKKKVISDWILASRKG